MFLSITDSSLLHENPETVIRYTIKHLFWVSVSFQDLLTTLSTILRGSIYEKLRWAFKLYDLNGDGCITRSELEKIVFSVHELMGKKCQVSSVYWLIKY